MHPRMFAVAIFAIFLLPAVTTGAPSPAADLSKLCDEYWQGTLKAYPTTATALGDKRYDDRLSDNSPAGIAREEKRLQDVLDRAYKVEETKLSPTDRLTRSLLIQEVKNQLASLSCRFHEWVVDPLGGPQVDFMNLPDITRIETPLDAANYVARARAMTRYMDQHVANLQQGVKHGKTASRDAVTKTIQQLERLTESPVESLAVMSPARAEHPGWTPGDRQRFRKDLLTAVDSGLRAALVRYRDFLRHELLPVARPQEKAGLSHLPEGVECYTKQILVHTSLEKSPQELHQLGLEQVTKFRRDLEALGAKALGTSDVTEIQKRLRSDRAMHFANAAEVEGKAREALARATDAVPRWFGRVRPKARCEVKVMGLHEAPYSTVAYYRQPSADGKRPGYYMINTYKPETRPRYEAEALAFHESIPGHHLQIAVAQELTGLPEFRKHQGVTAYVEGWGLYAERLADDMGLYSSDLDRIGMLSYDAWRACRLVVDTGLHAMGWSRQQAIDYMLANSVLAENNIVNEVDRYLTWPGQALAYKVGQLEILALRELAKQKLGERFDIKAFHDVVLSNGAVSLPVLRQQVEAWVGQLESARVGGGTP
jgi:uncharacterized protein (DUF885 family)